MLTALIVSQILSWLVIVALGVALLALARQVGILHMRVAPAGALTTGRGPAVGEPAPRLDLATIDGEPLLIGGRLAAGRRRLLLFVSAQCPLCKTLIPFAKSFAKDERVDLVLVGDDETDIQRSLIARFGLEAFPFVNGPRTGLAFEVDKLPHAVLLDENGIILARGLVNSREHLESLVISHEMGLKTVQDYIATLKTEAA
jgi:methylamine dehydrogenase accessory protein MauD